MSESPVTRSELRAELENQETRLLDHIDRVRIALLEHNEKIETNLLKEFRKWAISFESKFKANEALIVGFSERLTSVEERLSDLEQR